MAPMRLVREELGRPAARTLGGMIEAIVSGVLLERIATKTVVMTDPMAVLIAKTTAGVC